MSKYHASSFENNGYFTIDSSSDSLVQHALYQTKGKVLHFDLE
jgi:hypothetical protein